MARSIVRPVLSTVRPAPLDHLAGQLVGRQAKGSDHGSERCIHGRVANLEAAAGKNALIGAVYQACLQQDVCRGAAIDVVALEGTQVGVEFQVCVQAGVVAAYRDPAIGKKGVDHPVAQYPWRPVAPSRSFVGTDPITLGHDGNTRAVQYPTGLGRVDPQCPGTRAAGRAGWLGSAGWQQVDIQGFAFRQYRAGAEQASQEQDCQRTQVLHGWNSLMVSPRSK